MDLPDEVESGECLGSREYRGVDSDETGGTLLSGASSQDGIGIVRHLGGHWEWVCLGFFRTCRPWLGGLNRAIYVLILRADNVGLGL
jgi:hypothetical protein